MKMDNHILSNVNRRSIETMTPHRNFFWLITMIFVGIGCNASSLCLNYKVISVDSLQNGVYLIYLNKGSEQLKTISKTDSSKSKGVTLIEKGKTYPFCLKSLYKPTSDYMLKIGQLSPSHYYKGIWVEGNKIPLDIAGNDIYLILNANGLYLTDSLTYECNHIDSLLIDSPPNIRPTGFIVENGLAIDSIDATFIRNYRIIKQHYQSIF